MTDNTALSADTAVVTADQLAATAVKQVVRIPRLSAAQLELAKKTALSLKPTVKTIDLPVSLNLAEAARNAMSQISEQMLAGVTVKDMENANLLSSEALKAINSLDLEELSPEPREVKATGLFAFGRTVKETIEDVVKRVIKFMDGYQEINVKINRVLVETGNEYTAHTKTHSQLLTMKDRNWQLFHDLRVSYAAVKFFLSGPDGYEERERRNQAAADEVAAAEAEERDPDQMIIDAAKAYQSYIERVEMYGTTLSGAMTDAYQKSVAIQMLMENELIVMQGLDHLKKSVIPGWRDMLALAWAAYKQKGAIDFINTIRAADASIRIRKAKMIGQTAALIAEFKKSTTYDMASMRFLNEELVKAVELLKSASEEGARIREAAEAENADLVLALSKVAVA